MTWSLASGVATQANEAAQNVTAGASITGGVRFTCAAHGYAVGDYVRLASMATKFNGDHFISAVATNTFDIEGLAYSAGDDAVGTVARGDKDLSALTGTGISNTLFGRTGYEVRIVTLTNVRLVITGALYQDPRYNKLYMSHEALEVDSNFELDFIGIDSGGRYVLGRDGEYIGEGIITASRTRRHWQQFVIQINDGGEFVWRGATIIGTNIGIFVNEAGGTLRITNGRVYSSHQSFRSTAGWIGTESGGTLDVDGLFISGETQIIAFDAELSGLELVEGAVIEFKRTTIIDSSVDDVTAGRVGFANREWARFINFAQGTNAFVTGHRGVSQNREIECEWWSDLNVKLTDADGDDIEGAVVQVNDTDNGQRIGDRTGTTAFNLQEDGAASNADREYQATTGSDGTLANDLRILTGVQRTNGDVEDGNVTYDADATGYSSRVDRRSKSETRGSHENTDTFDVYVWSYGHEPIVVEQSMLGIGTKTVERILLADARITEATPATALAYTALDTAAKVYDHIKAAIADDYDAESEMPVTRSGDTLDFGDADVTLNETGSTVYARAANGDITLVTGTTFTGNLKTTGTITVDRDIRVVGAIRDSSGVKMRFTGLPAAHDAVIAAWPSADGETDRSNIITGGVPLIHRDDISLTAGSPATTATVATTGGSFSDFVVGNTVKLFRFANAANNGNFTVDSVAADGLSLVVSRDTGAFVDEAAGTRVCLSDQTATEATLQLAADTDYLFTADGVSYLRSEPSEFNSDELNAVGVSLRRILDAAGNDLVPAEEDLTADENEQFHNIEYNVTDDEIIFGGETDNQAYSFKATARAIEVGQSSEAAQANPYVCILGTGSFTFESGTSRMLKRKPGLATSIVPDLSAFQFTKVGSSDVKDIVDYSEGAIIVDNGVPAVVSVSVVGADEDDFHGYLDSYDIETGVNLRKAQRIGLAVLAGRVAPDSGDATMLEIHRLIDDTHIVTIEDFGSDNTRAAGTVEDD